MHVYAHVHVYACTCAQVLNGCHVSLDGWREEDEKAPELQQARAFLKAHPLAEFGHAEHFNGAVGELQLDWFRSQLARAVSERAKVIGTERTEDNHTRASQQLAALTVIERAHRWCTTLTPSPAHPLLS
jgi:hypothetical protein